MARTLGWQPSRSSRKRRPQNGCLKTQLHNNLFTFFHTPSTLNEQGESSEGEERERGRGKRGVTDRMRTGRWAGAEAAGHVARLKMSNAKSAGRRDAMFFFGVRRGGWQWAVGKRHSKSNYEPTLRQQHSSSSSSRRSNNNPEKHKDSDEDESRRCNFEGWTV